MTGLGGAPAWAFSLGRVTVSSMQGEPLRAEIDITELKDDEAASLKVGIAPADMYRAAGLTFDPQLARLQIELQKRPDGRAYLRLRGDQAVSTSYLDLVLEVSWATGRTLRDYTLLFEPPRPQPEPVATPAQITPPSPQAAASDSAAMAPAASPAPQAQASVAAPAPKAAPAAKAASRSITVKAGDTAGKIAAANLPADVSLEQMLLALLRANPNAFINGNVNLVKAGATLTLPNAEQARAVGTAKEARRMVVAQSKDFNEYRRRLAGHAPKTAVSTPRREASGAVEARVEDKKASAPSADKLTLSKGASKDSKATREDEISQQHNEKEAAHRAAELAKNISELNKLSAELAQPAASQASAAAGPALATATPAPAAMPPATPASTPVAAASEPQAPASAASSPAAAPMATPTWLDALIDTPMLPVAAVSLIALLTALGLYRARRRRRHEPLVSSPLVDAIVSEEPTEPAAPAAEASRGTPAAPAAPAMPPQDADPVAEADVYLAYGRDLQAEAVLREGLRTEPKRMAIHQKLLDIYSRRLDLDNFEAKAREVLQLTGGTGEDWARVCALGQEIDPTNRLYGGDYTGVDEATEEPAVTSAPPAMPSEEPGEDDWPLDTETRLPEPSAATPAVPMELTLDLNLDLDTPPADDAKPEIAPEVAPEPVFEPEAPPAAPAKAVEPPSPQAVEAGQIDLDMDALALDAEAPPPAPPADDPLGVKLALAEEFNAIGDADGARALIEEVIAEATGDMKAKAEEALAKLRR